MKRRCPYCGTVCNIEDPVLSERKTRLYRAVIESGKDGITSASLLAHMYAFGEKPSKHGFVVMRVQVHDINKKLAPFNKRIQARPRGRYRLVSIKEES